MRRFLVFCSLVVACGGGDKATTPPPPPPPTPVATTISVQTGDNQTAAAGSPVAVAPAVIVRDQAGQPMGGVQVVFAVDSGGGTIANPTATTGADGVASGGAWSLGVGRNRLRVSSGSLAPVFFSATTTGELQVGGGSVGPTGGVVTVNRPGTPVDGMQLTFPGSAVSGALQVTVAYGDSTGAPRKAGLRLASPVITIGTNDAFSDTAGPVRLSVPATINANEAPIAILFNRATGAMMTLPTVVTGPGRVLTIARHLDATQLDLPGAGGIVASAAHRASNGAVSAAIQLVIGAVLYSDLQVDFNTGYQPSVDDWELDHILTWLAPTIVAKALAGLGLTAAWYFDKYKQGRGALNGRYQQAKGVELSNPRGYKIGAMAGLQVNGAAVFAYDNALKAVAQVATPPITVDSLTFLAVKAGLFSTNRPYILFAIDPSGTNTAASMLVYATTGNTLSVSLGTAVTGMNAPRSIALSNGSFSPFTWGIKSPETGTLTPYTLPRIVATGLTSGVQASTLTQLWQEFFSNTLGQGVFPTIEVSSREIGNLVDTLFVPDDTTRFWVECLGCQYGYQLTGQFTPRNKLAGGVLHQLPRSSTTWQKLGTAVYGLGLRVNGDNSDLSSVGLGVIVSPDASGTIGQASYVDWKQFVIKAKRLTFTPNPLSVAGGYNFTLTASYSRPLPAGASWTWEMGDGRTLTTATNILTTQYPATTTTKTYDIKASLKGGTVLEATGHITATVKPALFGWNLSAATVTASTLPPGGIGSEALDTLIFNTATQVVANLQATPSRTTIFVVGVANGGPACAAVGVWYQFPAGQPIDVVPPSAVPVGVLGVCGSPDYTGSLALGTIGSGTLVGSATEIPMPDAIELPGGSINATMSGKNLTGSFVWKVRYSTGIATYTVSFQGVQVTP